MGTGSVHGRGSLNQSTRRPHSIAYTRLFLSGFLSRIDGHLLYYAFSRIGNLYCLQSSYLVHFYDCKAARSGAGMSAHEAIGITMAPRRKAAFVEAPPAAGSTMNARLALLPDDEIDRLRTRIVQLTKMGTPEQRQASSGQLEAIDVERERRLALQAT